MDPGCRLAGAYGPLDKTTAPHGAVHTRTTETGSRDDHPHTGRHIAPDASRFPAPLPPASKSPEIHRKTWGRPRAIPECEHRQEWVAEGAVSSEPVSPRVWASAHKFVGPTACSARAKTDPGSAELDEWAQRLPGGITVPDGSDRVLGHYGLTRPSATSSSPTTSGPTRSPASNAPSRLPGPPSGTCHPIARTSIPSSSASRSSRPSFAPHAVAAARRSGRSSVPVSSISALTNAATIFGTAGTRPPHGHEKRFSDSVKPSAILILSGSSHAEAR